MIVEDWPIPAAGGTPNPSAHAAEVSVRPDFDRRLAVARTDFFLDAAFRLTDQQRALMTAMLRGLIATIADELRVRLTGTEAREDDADALVARLANAGLLQSDEMVGLLLRRTDEASIAAAARRPAPAGGVLTTFSGDDDPAIAAAAMALVIARGRARDRFGRQGIAVADLNADLAVSLLHAIAASLASGPASHRALTVAADDMLARHDDGQRREALEARLVHHLEAADRLQPDLLLVLGRQGEGALLGEALARMAGIPGDDGRALALLPSGEGLPWLLRLANQRRSLAATLFSESGEVFGALDPASAIDSFDAIDDAAAEAERRRLRLPPAYRAALAALSPNG